MMADDLEAGMKSLGLNEYTPGCKNAGFPDWNSLDQITEDDMASIHMRLGDRRKLQREIARRHRWPDYEPLPTSEHLERHNSFSSGKKKNLYQIDISGSDESQTTVTASDETASSSETATSPAAELETTSEPEDTISKLESVSGNLWQAYFSNLFSRLGSSLQELEMEKVSPCPTANFCRLSCRNLRLISQGLGTNEGLMHLAAEINQTIFET
jgi:hypothetical protein